MRRHGLRGVRRGKVVRTTISNSKAACPLDRVNRVFKAERPNQRWVPDWGPADDDFHCADGGSRHEHRCTQEQRLEAAPCDQQNDGGHSGRRHQKPR